MLIITDFIFASKGASPEKTVKSSDLLRLPKHWSKALSQGMVRKHTEIVFYLAGEE